MVEPDSDSRRGPEILAANVEESGRPTQDKFPKKYLKRGFR